MLSGQLLAANNNVHEIAFGKIKTKEYCQKFDIDTFSAVISIDDDMVLYPKKNNTPKLTKPIFRWVKSIYLYPWTINRLERINPLLSDIPPPSYC